MPRMTSEEFETIKTACVEMSDGFLYARSREWIWDLVAEVETITAQPPWRCGSCKHFDRSGSIKGMGFCTGPFDSGLCEPLDESFGCVFYESGEE